MGKPLGMGLLKGKKDNHRIYLLVCCSFMAAALFYSSTLRTSSSGSHIFLSKSLLVQSCTKPPLPFPVKGFWHIAQIPGVEEWEMVVHEQTLHIQAADMLDTMNMTAVFLGEEESAMPKAWDPRITIEFGGKPDQFEYPTLRKVQEYCSVTPNARVIYFHSKGARHTFPFAWGPYYWRLLLEHFVIRLHYTLLSTDLSDTSPYNSAGALKAYEPIGPHYIGNFWAAKCSYINQLPPINSLDTTKPGPAEFWIGKGPDWEKGAKNCFEPKKEECGNYKESALYHCRLKPTFYQNMTTCGRSS